MNKSRDLIKRCTNSSFCESYPKLTHMTQTPTKNRLMSLRNFKETLMSSRKRFHLKSNTKKASLTAENSEKAILMGTQSL